MYDVCNMKHIYMYIYIYVLQTHILSLYMYHLIKIRHATAEIVGPSLGILARQAEVLRLRTSMEAQYVKESLIRDLHPPTRHNFLLRF